MKFLDITITNYGSFFGTHVFKLADRGLVLILGDNRDDPRMNSNAAGKSMIPDALDWCLTGVVPRGDVADSVINEKAKKGTEVLTRVQADDGSIITIARRRKVKGEKDGLRFWVGEHEHTTLDVAESQRRLEKFLGMDREVLHAAVLFAQFDDWGFADATDAERKALLTRIIPELAIIDEWLELAKEAAGKIADLSFQAETLETRKNAELQALLTSDPRALAHEWEQQRQVRLDTARGKVTEYTAGLQALASELAAVPHTPEPPAPQLSPELAQVQQETLVAITRVNTAFQAQGAVKARVEAHAAAHAAIQEGKTCPTCGQAVDPGQPPPMHETELADKQLGLVTLELEAAQTQLAWLQTRAGELNDAHQVQTQQHAAHIQTVQQSNHRHHRLVARHEEIERELVNLQLALSQAETNQEVNPYTERVTTWLQTHESLTAELSIAQQERARLDEVIPYYRFWVDAFGPKGIKSHILDSRLQEMTDEANRWVHLLTGGTIWVRFETQTQTGKGKKAKLVDKFAVRCFRHNPDGTQTSRNYRSWCGGEKHRIATGIDFGLARLVAKRAEQSYDLLFLDEIFGKHLDQAGKEAVAELLQHLAAEKSSIFVIDHDPRFQGTFAETVVVQKVNGESRILEASHEQH